MHKNKKIAADLQAWRRRAGLSQADLAHLLSVHISKVSDMETGATRPNLNDLVRMSLIFGKPLDLMASALVDANAYCLITRLGKMPRAPRRWRKGSTRANTLSGLARRLEGYNDRQA